MNYRLCENAKKDLIRIHQYGVYKFGEVQADKYFFAFFDQFKIIQSNPYLFPSVDYIKKGYKRSLCGVDSTYYRINDKVVEIMAIVGRQDIKPSLEKI